MSEEQLDRREQLMAALDAAEDSYEEPVETEEIRSENTAEESVEVQTSDADHEESTEDVEFANLRSRMRRRRRK